MITGMPRSASTSSRALPIPEVRSTPPNMPPAPVIRMTEHTGPRADSNVFSIAEPLTPRALPMVSAAMMSVSVRAMGVSPIARSSSNHNRDEVSSETAPDLASVPRPVLRKISSMGSNSMATTVPTAGGLRTSSA